MSDDSSTLDQFTNQFRQTDDDKTDDQTGTESDVKQGPDVKPKAENEVEVESEGGVVDDLDESELWELTNDGCDDVSRPEFQMAAIEVLMKYKDEWLSLVQDKYCNAE